MRARSQALSALMAACLLLFALAPATAADKLEFSEVWAYLMDGEEKAFSASRPITDVGYFGAGISSYGKLVGVPARSRLKGYGGRVHLVVAEIGNYALTHFSLDPEYPLRDALIGDIAAASESFDGVQIDFEALLSKDYDNFRAFLALLKGRLGSKVLSVALPARLSDKGDLFDYAKIGELADRVVIMAYDEHWSGSEPGPVASISWCRKVSAYALSKIPAGKLVMGAPFYGRAWADKNLSRAYKYSGFAGLVEEKQLGAVQRREGIPFVEYVETVSVKAYFEDAASAYLRLSMYKAASIDKVAFWRLGQEDPTVWEAIAVTPLAPLSGSSAESGSSELPRELSLPSILRPANRGSQPALAPR
jgi:spore germination protein